MFSHLNARRSGAPPREATPIPQGATPIRPAQPVHFGVPARAARPLVAVVACAAAVTLAGCKPGALTSATPSAGTSASAADSPAAMSVMTSLASHAQSVKSFAAKLKIHATGSGAARVSGTLTEQTRPSTLVDVRTTVPAGLEAILTSDTAFLKIGALTRTDGQPWLAVPFSGLNSGMDASLTPLIQQIAGSNLLAQTQMFAAAANVRNMGTAQINGVRTTQFRGSYGRAAGLGKLSGNTQARVRSAMMSSGITSTKFTVWVDSQHQARKISLVEVGKNTRIDIVLVIVSVNQPVQIQVPPANQVVGATATPTRKPRVTITPTPSMMMTPTPRMTVMPTPTVTVTVTPTPVSPVTPSPLPTGQPTHW